MEFKKGTLLYRALLRGTSTQIETTTYEIVKKEENGPWYIALIYKGRNGVERKGRKEIFYPADLDAIFRGDPYEEGEYLVCTSLNEQGASIRVLEAAIMCCEQEVDRLKERGEKLRQRLSEITFGWTINDGVKQ